MGKIYLVKQLIVHQWKEKIRGSFWQKSIGINIILGFLLLYFATNFIILGYYTDKLILSAYANINLLEKLSQLLFYYFSIDVFIRFLFQSMPSMSIEPYLHLPIKKKTIFNYLLIKSLFSFFNLLPLLIIIPFSIKTLFMTGKLITGSLWLTVIIILIAINNFFVFYLKKLFLKKPITLMLFLLLILFMYLLEVKNVLNLSVYFKSFIILIVNQPLFIIIPIIILITIYKLDVKLLLKNSYMENIVDSSVKYAKPSSYLTGLNRFGRIGKLIQLELKMIWRNKRTRGYVFVGIMFLLYGFIVYPDKGLVESPNFIIMIGIIIIGSFSIQYGQLIFAWESSYFDFILSKNIHIREFISAKYRFLITMHIFGFLLSIPYGLFDVNIIYVNFSLLLYSIGFNIFFILYFALYNKKSVDLNGAVMMNYEGFGIVNYLLVIPLFGGPVLIYFLFNLYFSSTIAYTTIALIGILGIIFQDELKYIIVKKMLKRKYIMSSAFRGV